MLRTHLNQLVSLAKWSSVHLKTKEFWVRIQLQSLHIQNSRLLRARSFLTFWQLRSLDSLWSTYGRYKNIQSNGPYTYVLGTQLHHLVNLAKWLCLSLRTKWFRVRTHLQSLHLQIYCLLLARSSLTGRQLWMVDSLWNTYVNWQEHTVKGTVQISTENTAQLFCQFVQMVECWFNS